MCFILFMIMTASFPLFIENCRAAFSSKSYLRTEESTIVSGRRKGRGGGGWKKMVFDGHQGLSLSIILHIIMDHHREYFSQFYGPYLPESGLPFITSYFTIINNIIKFYLIYLIE